MRVLLYCLKYETLIGKVYKYFFFSLLTYAKESPVMEQATDSDSNRLLPAEKYYQIEELNSRAFITPDSDIPEKLLHLWYPS